MGIGVANKVCLKEKIVALATAHPAKFPEIVKKATNQKPDLPSNLKNILIKNEKFDKLSNNLKIIKKYILKRAI